jgi:hypothetical protein
MKITNYTWNSRLWTLQEGALAKTLFFRFADGLYDLDEGVIRVNNSNEQAMEHSLKAPIIQRVHEFRGFRQIENSLEPKISAISVALGFRSTSIETDEALCLAALLGLDMIQVIQVPPQDRIAKLWSLFNTVPENLTFHELPRLKAKGYH